jgi:hypothetical protein
MFIFDKQLDPFQAINYKPTSKAPFGFMTVLQLGAATGGAATALPIYCADPTVVQPAPPAGGAGGGAAKTPNALALLTRIRWNMGASDPILIEGLTTISIKQSMVSLLYAGLDDISIAFTARAFEYDPTASPKKYYACFDTTITQKTGKLQKDNDGELGIEIGDKEELAIQENSFYAFSLRIVPSGTMQQIILASKNLGNISKDWGHSIG